MNLTLENYFSPEAERYYMGSTQFKRFLECESLALAHIRGEWTEESSTALLVGSYVDAHFSRSLDVFKAHNPGIFKRDGELKAEYLQANDIIARIERDEMFMKAMSGDPQVIMTGAIAGVPVKIRIDSLLPGRTVDLKVMRDMRDIYMGPERGYEPFWKAWGYHYQAAIYQEIRRQNDGIRKPFGLAVATKESPEPDIALLELPEEEVRAALEEIEARIVHFDSLKQELYEPERCERCPWCRATKRIEGWRVA